MKIKRAWQKAPRLGLAIALVVSPLLLTAALVPSSSAQSFTENLTTPRHTEAVSTLTPEGRLAVFDDAWQTIHDRYYDPRFRGIDWDNQRALLRPEAARAANGQELYAVLRKLVGALNDVHTRIYAPEEKFDWWSPRFISIGISVREVDGLPIVVHVEEDSAPDKAGLRPGDVIEAVDGVPALSVVDRRLAKRPAAALRASLRFRAFSGIFEGAAQTSVALKWRTRHGELRQHSFERRWQGRRLGLQLRRERGKYAVIQIDAFTPSIALDFTRTLKKNLKGVRGIVVDLRGNGGGEAEAMADVASSFLGEGVALGTFTDRWGHSFSVRTRAKSLLAAEALTRTNLPLVVLVSERTSSAAEIFVATMVAQKRATIIGTETCGCVLAIRTQHALPDGGVLDVSELDYRTGEGVRLEENGIKPQDVVVPRRADLYFHHDRVLEFALDKLSQARPASR